MSAYTPGDSGSPDSEPTRRLRTGDTRDSRTGLGRIASMEAPLHSLPRGLAEHEEPDASPRKWGTCRTCVRASSRSGDGARRGLPHHWSVHLRHPAELLYQQAESNLKETSHRVAAHLARW